MMYGLISLKLLVNGSEPSGRAQVVMPLASRKIIFGY